ncbi:hypothetical protein BC941DRAFT_457619 [Chlamydoabsidia padenii]|nr:hypothetical protein BC941DRAFT_457619 [Chlamydoabsidia padenii]
MLKLLLGLIFSLLVLTVSCIPAKRSFEPVMKTATAIEITDIADPEFVIPCPEEINEDTYFLFYELHGDQLIKNTLLTCDDNTPGGTHPQPALACEEILEVEGDCGKIDPAVCFCPADFDPVVVNVQGKFKGTPFKLLQTFQNPCIFKCATKSIEHFVTIGLGLN